MNTNNLKRFAQEARRKLLEQVGAKLSFVLNADSAILREQAEQVQQLRLALDHSTKEQLIEKVAYTWFNRLMALRFMDANDYQPIGIKVITPKDGYTTPEILDEAKQGNIPEGLKLNRQKINDLLDGRILSANPQNEAFKQLLISACNNLNEVLPFLFERIDDYSELLLPDDLTSDFSIVTDIRNGMLAVDCVNVEIIGWLYQFYISEKKDEVFASKEKVCKEDIPAATQLFTPRWIVEYMVQNTLGKLWLQNRPKSRLRDYMPYFIESTSLNAEDYLKINSPEEIKFLDPASGSGHILVYAFDLFTKIYEEEGYNTSDIPKLIIEKNLFGFEIDERAAQLSGLALMFKAREYNRRAFRKEIKPNIICFQDLNLSSKEITEAFTDSQLKISNDLLNDLVQMHQITNIGSLIVPKSNLNEIIRLSERFRLNESSSDLFQENKIIALRIAFNQLLKLAEKYHCVVANPPYMGSGNMNKELSDFVRTNYPDSRADLMACFMELGLAMLLQQGYLGMINQHSWMFLSSFEELRKKLINSVYFDNLLHLGARTFPEIGGEVVQNTAFVFRKNRICETGIYIRLVDFDNSELKRTNALKAIQNPNCGWFFRANQNDFGKIPSSPIGYWASSKLLSIYENKSLSNYATPRAGMITGNNFRFLRFFFEVAFSKIGFNHLSKNSAEASNKYWFPYQKGGSFRKWYGNNEYVVQFANDGKLLRTTKNENGKVPAHAFNDEYIFKPNVNWSALTAGKFSTRITENGFLFDASGSAAFPDSVDAVYSLSAFLNSNITQKLLSIINPTLNFQAWEIGGLPINQQIFTDELILLLAKECKEIAQADWDSREISWDFNKNGLLPKQFKLEIELQEHLEAYQQLWAIKFFSLHRKEELLNQQVIKLFELTDEVSHIVPLQEIIILQDELDREVFKELNSKLSRDPITLLVNNYQELSLPLISNSLINQFISYAVGCMFGRYSLDKEGIILANEEETLQDYLHFIGKTLNECSFLPDMDNIVPVLEDEWFEDDIVNRFNYYLKVTFGEKNFNKNLAFIEEQLGKNIRKYFTKDFYSDHVQRYKKRPIYWMFSSPKGSFNVLIYMHRYNPDTLSNILNKYLREFIGKLKTRKEHLQHIMVSGSPSQITSAIKENDSIDKMIVELQEYERDILFPLATERIAIDLDDGVLVNYNKLGKAVKEVAGLNDAITKKKVKQFDWIDITQIR